MNSVIQWDLVVGKYSANNAEIKEYVKKIYYLGVPRLISWGGLAAFLLQNGKHTNISWVFSVLDCSRASFNAIRRNQGYYAF